MPLVGAISSLLGAASVFPVCWSHRTEQGMWTGTEERQCLEEETNPSREPLGNKGLPRTKTGLWASI